MYCVYVAFEIIDRYLKLKRNDYVRKEKDQSFFDTIFCALKLQQR